MILLLPLQVLASKPPTRPLQKADAAHGKYVVREGLHALPKTMFDLFFKAVGVFFVEGHEALPCTRYVRSKFGCVR